MMRTKIIGAAMAAFLAGITSANAVVIGTGPANGTGGAQGLHGEFYNMGPFGSITQAETAIANNAPTATFMSSKVDYPQGNPVNTGSGNTLQNFLGSDAGSLSGSGSTILVKSAFRFHGYIEILASDDTISGGLIDVGFRLGSDDGSRLRIGGQIISTRAFPTGFSYSPEVLVSFSAAGLYAFDVTYWENYGATGISVLSDLNDGYINCHCDTVPTNRLFKNIIAPAPVPGPGAQDIPEPGTLVLFGFGLAGLGFVRRRKAA